MEIGFESQRLTLQINIVKEVLTLLYDLEFQPYCGVCNVEKNFLTYFKFLTNKVIGLFKVEGLPETVDKNYFLTSVILKGRVCFTQFKNNIYCLTGNIGGEPNAYYKPCDFIIANPILGSKQVKVRNRDGSNNIKDLEGILVGITPLDLEVSGDYPFGGYYPLIYQTAGLLADNISSINIAQINSRASVAFTADSPEQAASAEEVLKDIYEGRPYRVLSQNILEKITTTPLAASGSTNTLTNLIESRRSIMQDFYNEIGIGYQGNAKRERVNTAEVGLMRGCLDVSITTAIKTLKEGIGRVNELFGTSITIELNDEVFYEGSGNAALGPEDITNENIVEKDVVDQDDANEKNTNEVIETYEEKGITKKDETEKINVKEGEPQ